MEKGLMRFWFEFETNFNFPPGIVIGCGVTAFSYDDAIKLMDEKIFYNSKRPPFKKIIENVNIYELDQGHVVPNMKPIVNYGIWFPLGFD